MNIINNAMLQEINTELNNAYDKEYIKSLKNIEKKIIDCSANDFKDAYHILITMKEELKAMKIAKSMMQELVKQLQPNINNKGE